MRRGWVIATMPVFAVFCGCTAADRAGVQRTVRADGVGQARIMPDMCVLNVSVSHCETDIETAREKTLAGSRRVVEAARRFPLDESLSFAENLSLSRKENYRTDAFIGYNMSQDFCFVISDLDLADDLTEAVIGAGATYAWSWYRSSQQAELAPHARALAVENARLKAERMAALLGQRLGAPISVRPIGEDEDYYDFDRRIDNDDDGPELPIDAASGLAVLPPRMIEVTAAVRVEFELLPASPRR